MAKSQTLIIPGPPTTRFSRAQAEEKLKGHPRFPKGASYAVEEVEGRWVAAFTFEAAPPFGDESPADDAPAGPPTDGPPKDDSGDDSSGGDSNPFGGDDKGDGDKPGGDEKGGGGELGEIKQMLTTLLTAMGIGGPDASMMPGDEVGPPDGHDPTAPDAAGDPEHGDLKEGEDPRDNKTHTVHERALKPGEAPPGTTPVGAPSFASVRIPEDHPWRNRIASGEQEWITSDYMDDTESIGVVAKELKSLAEPYGYRVKQLNDGRDAQGNRVARARISRVV